MSPKRITNEEINNEVIALRTKVQKIQEHLNRNHEVQQKDSASFLLAEFNHLSNIWQHTDSRMEKGINIYVTLNAIIVSGLMVLSQQITNYRVFTVIGILITCGLAVIGTLLSIRIMTTKIIKIHYLDAINLIRRYFVDNEESLQKYLLLPVANNLIDSSDKRKIRRHIPVPKVVTFIHVWNALLLSFAVGSILWIIKQTFHPLLPLAGGIVVGIVSFTVLELITKKRIRA